MWYQRTDPVFGRVLEGGRVLELLRTKEPMGGVGYSQVRSLIQGATALFSKAQEAAAPYEGQVPDEEFQRFQARLEQGMAALEAINARLRLESMDWADMYDAIIGPLSLCEEAGLLARDWGRAEAVA